MVGFTGVAIGPQAFSTRPFQFVRPDEKPFFGLLSDILLLETAPPATRRKWKTGQLSTLLHHARQRSGFWRARIGTAELPSPPDIAGLLALTPTDVKKQVATEGSLLTIKDGVEVKSRTTSDSTGAAVSFYVTQANDKYNEIRSFAQFLIEGRDIGFNRCNVTCDPRNTGVNFRQSNSYSGPLSSIFVTGKNAEMNYYGMDLARVVDHLRKFKPHYLECSPQFIEAMLLTKGKDVFSRLDARHIITRGQPMSAHAIEQLQQVGITHSSNYSCEEVGPIAWECPHNKGHFHVCESNVIVEIGEKREVIGGVTCGNILITGLHSYATPFIRYELGDYAQLLNGCPCGFDGQVLTQLVGLATTLKLPDGTRRPFHVSTEDLRKRIRYSDLRVRQVDTKRVTVEIAAKHVTDDERIQAIEWLSDLIGAPFKIEFIFLHEIDWGMTQKRNVFLNLDG